MLGRGEGRALGVREGVAGVLGGPLLGPAPSVGLGDDVVGRAVGSAAPTVSTLQPADSVASARTPTAVAAAVRTPRAPLFVRIRLIPAPWLARRRPAVRDLSRGTDISRDGFPSCPVAESCA